MTSVPVSPHPRHTHEPLAELWAAPHEPRRLLALVPATAPAAGFALAWADPTHRLLTVAAEPGECARLLAEVERRLAPRWVWWSAAPAAEILLAGGTRPGACWDLAAVHRLLHGGRRGDPGAVWAAVTGQPVPPAPVPATRSGHTAPGQLDLWETVTSEPAIDTAAAAPAGVNPAGVYGPAGDHGPGDNGAGSSPGAGEWGLGEALGRAGELAVRALRVQAHQDTALRRLGDGRARPGRTPLPVLTARAESAAELLARELEHDGLPVDRPAAVALLADLLGPPPRTPAEEAAARRRRDAPVLAHLPRPVDLRNPAAVRAGLRSVGIDVPDTRSGRLEPLRAAHPVVGALLTWRRLERIATTYGHRWLDTHVGADGRLRGTWHASDGGAGRMSAQAGLHNLPADLRTIVAAEPGRVLVRADLGQIEPRVLAIVSADPALVRATHADDMYAPVATQLGRDRPEAKVAMLAAMYGQTTGSAGEALRRMRHAYPAALAYLDDAEATGRAGRDLRTYGGRLLRLADLARPATGTRAPETGRTDPPSSDDLDGIGGLDGPGVPAPPPRVPESARGRFARNAVIQGPAAELFKAWAATVRAELPALDGEVVLCLHDELLLHVPAAHAQAAVNLLRRALAATGAYWATGSGVRLVADVAVLRRWSDATH
jgi:DNA polymerase-1